MKDIDKNREKALDIARLAAERSGAAFFVGGYVRDKLMGIADTENKDIDIEVHVLHQSSSRRYWIPSESA